LVFDCLPPVTSTAVIDQTRFSSVSFEVQFLLA
jgi:hypothetical protein